jgi:hypothetical protein
MEPNPDERITVTELFAHPCIKGDYEIRKVVTLTHMLVYLSMFSTKANEKLAQQRIWGSSNIASENMNASMGGVKGKRRIVNMR